MAAPPSELARSPGPHPDSRFLLSISLHQLPSSPLYSVTSASGIAVLLSLSTPASLDLAAIASFTDQWDSLLTVRSPLLPTLSPYSIKVRLKHTAGSLNLSVSKLCTGFLLLLEKKS